MPSQLTQDSLLNALIQLRQVHPGLPTISWEISAHPTVSGLFGKTHGDSVDALLAYYDALGGDITAGIAFGVPGSRRQLVRLRAVFAEVRIEIQASVLAPEMTGLHLVEVAA